MNHTDHDVISARRRRAVARARNRRAEAPQATNELDRAMKAITTYLATMPATSEEEREFVAAEILADLIEAGWKRPNGYHSA